MQHLSHPIRTLTACSALVALLCGSVAANASAGEIQPLADIQHAAEQQAMSQLSADPQKSHVTADRLDERLRLPACAAPLQASLPYGANPGAKITVAVRCTATGSWTVNVPVTVETEAQMLVLTRSVARGSAITADALEIRSQRMTGLGSANLNDAGQLAGMHARRDLAAGTLLMANMLEPDVLIKRGQQITLLVSVGGIEVRSQGIALSDGSANARIRVQNLNSAKVVEGMVDNGTQVRVQL